MKPYWPGTPDEQVAAFNARFPVGSVVHYWPISGTPDGPEKCVTRTPAWVTHGGGVALVSLQGRSGGVLLDHVRGPEVDGVLV